LGPDVGIAPAAGRGDEFPDAVQSVYDRPLLNEVRREEMLQAAARGWAALVGLGPDQGSEDAPGVSVEESSVEHGMASGGGVEGQTTADRAEGRRVQLKVHVSRELICIQ
jgi:hypothetical protein